MGKYEITYFMYPADNVVIIIWAKSEEEAVIFAKQHRQGAFSVKEVRI